MKKKDRITSAEKELRIYQVYQMILNGFPRHKILIYGSGAWKACSRTMDDYISEVNQMMKNHNIKNYDYNLNLMNARIEDLINKCSEDRDKKTMVQLLKLQSDILGLNKQQVELSGSIDTTIRVIKLSGPDDGTTD
jgi:hypothetical protein